MHCTEVARCRHTRVRFVWHELNKSCSEMFSMILENGTLSQCYKWKEFHTASSGISFFCPFFFPSTFLTTLHNLDIRERKSKHLYTASTSVDPPDHACMLLQQCGVGSALAFSFAERNEDNTSGSQT